MGDPREPTPAFIREALVASVEEVSSYPRATGLPELRTADRRLDRAPLRRRRSTPRPSSFRRSARRRRSSPSRRSRSARSKLVAIPEPAYPVYERGALFAGGSVVDRAARRGRRLAARPRRVRRVGRDRALLDVLPEQPDRRRRAALVLRGARRARPRARLPALLGRGVLGALVRRAADVGARARRPHERRRLQHALEALVDDRVPVRLRLRAARRSRDALRAFRPTVGTAPQEFVQRASIAAWSDEEHVQAVRDVYRAQARRGAACARGEGPPAGRLDRDVLPLGRRRRAVDPVRRAAARARHRLRAGRVLRAGRRGLRPLRARADAGGVRARRGDHREGL